MGAFSVVVRTSASAASGLGHLRRCLALADALDARGGRVAFAVDDPAADVFVRGAGFPVEHVGGRMLPEPGAADVIVIDGYQYDAALVAAARDRARVVVALEDLYDRVLPAHVVVHSGVEVVAGAYPADTELLLVPVHALLPSEFAEVPSRVYGARVGRVLVSVGAADPLGAAASLTRITREAIPSAVVDVVVGPFFAEAAAAEDGVRLWRNPANMRSLMVDADLAVTAGGQTMLQLAACATPMVAVSLFDNQDAQLRELARRDAVVSVGRWTDDGVAARISEALRTLADPAARAARGRAARAAVDGGGASRVADRVVARLEVTGG
jgi:spore coat polysaccharide biosynthesis predicted glycosyltransferase SpsG